MSAAARSNVLPFSPHGHDGSCDGLLEVRRRVGDLEKDARSFDVRLTRIETRLAIFAAGGSLVGGGVVAAAVELLKHVH